jgi:hypothetical protein
VTAKNTGTPYERNKCCDAIHQAEGVTNIDVRQNVHYVPATPSSVAVRHSEGSAAQLVATNGPAMLHLVSLAKRLR